MPGVIFWLVTYGFIFSAGYNVTHPTNQNARPVPPPPKPSPRPSPKPKPSPNRSTGVKNSDDNSSIRPQPSPAQPNSLITAVERARDAISRGQSYLTAGNLTEAEKAFREAMQANPSDSRGFAGLGDTLKKQSRFTEAEEAYRTALHISPGNPQYLTQLGGFLYEQRRYEEAIAQFKKAVAAVPGSGLFRTNLIAAYVAFGDSLVDDTLAIAQYSNAITAGATTGAPFYKLGVRYLRLNRFREATETFEQAATLKIADPVSLYYLGRLYVHTGNTSLAMKQYSALQEVASFNALSLAGTLLSAIGRGDKLSTKGSEPVVLIPPPVPGEERTSEHIEKQALLVVGELQSYSPGKLKIGVGVDSRTINFDKDARIPVFHIPAKAASLEKAVIIRSETQWRALQSTWRLDVYVVGTPDSKTGKISTPVRKIILKTKDIETLKVPLSQP